MKNGLIKNFAKPRFSFYPQWNVACNFFGDGGYFSPTTKPCRVVEDAALFSQITSRLPR